MCLSAPSLSSSASLRFAGCLADSHPLTFNPTFGLAPPGSLEEYALSNIQDLSAPLLFDFSVAEVSYECDFLLDYEWERCVQL
ncbi:hypothetical protein KXW98_009029 [Aspergillus fumigatus]|uniref:Uncharacterized protein n=3 Tax=Aspergillus fumigatus TaxID=746128 RepID=A4D9E6_ASPFU|nr:hypothetical protein AFUA_3G10085 [Aspergillus fumigatus Af293]EDP52740.1 hypothetical protein AFUB_039090 [Aspergillus fumigatus A1163]KAF4253387.1 hypothetical protein CNMCM8057_005512 [Aspergillus fumigatus]EBA27464.1 hypothetical protein AFUA_3G10085 [Aspergillus fumigatus Af293]KAF4253928.1 hypothetical protein CNMCM8714_005674 [Aspergillus fumigatus]KAF4260111.1 hypothetical protein CNMCM8812_005584 [Aspergillus fumigatus]